MRDGAGSTPRGDAAVDEDVVRVDGAFDTDKGFGVARDGEVNDGLDDCVRQSVRVSRGNVFGNVSFHSG